MKVVRPSGWSVALACLLVFYAGFTPAWSYTHTGSRTGYNGTSGDDILINNGYIYGLVDMTQGGADSITNNLTISGSISMSGHGGILTNSGPFGNITGYIYGNNWGTGGITINNTGTITGYVYGNYQAPAIFDPNALIDSPVSITNSGTITGGVEGNLAGTGAVNIINSGTVTDSIIGNDQGTGNVTINNSGSVGHDISTMAITGVVMGTGNVYITNSGNVTGLIYGLATGIGDAYITNSGAVTGSIYGLNSGRGKVTINNSGSVSQYIYGVYGGQGDSTINNTGTANAIMGNGLGTGNTYIINDHVANLIYGNVGGTGDSHITNTSNGSAFVIMGNSSGTGNVYIVNNGTVDSAGGIMGLSSGGTGNVYITNNGSAGNILGNGSGSGNGDIYITNSGSVVFQIMGNGSGIGEAHITNSGTVGQEIIGNASIGTSYITNSGTVGSHIIGNQGGQGDSYITNSGTVNGNIIGNTGGTGNSYITNSGTVTGSILAGPGNDTVTILAGSNVGGVVDGQAGTNTLNYQLPGSIDQATLLAKYLNFQNYSFGSTGSGTILTGNWTLGGGFTVNNYASATVSGNTTVNGDTTANGLLTVNTGGQLTTGNLIVGSNGGATINGTTVVSSDTTVNGLLVVGSGGQLTTGGLAIGGTGTSTILGEVVVSGGTTVGGNLAVFGHSLRTGTLDVQGGGTVNVHGDTLVSGATTVDGTLNVTSDGFMSTDSLGIGQGGLVDISGTLTTNSTDDAGRLHVNGTLNSSTALITSSGLLWGTGQINGRLTLYGSLAPGDPLGTLRINGSLTTMPGSLYLVQLASDGRDGQTMVNGPAAINGGRVLTSLPQALYRDHFAWTILSASDGVSGAFQGVDGQPNSQTLSLHTVGYADHVNLEVWRKPFASFAPGGAGGLGAGLDGLVPLAVVRQDRLAGLIYNMDWSYSASQIGNALTRLSPEMYTSYLSAGLEGAAVFDQALSRRVEEVRLGRLLGLAPAPQGAGLLPAVSDEAAPMAEPVEPGPEARGWSFWGGGLGSWSSRGGSGGGLGYRQRLGGLAGGVDGRMNDWLLVGLGVGASKSDLDWGQTYLSGGMKGLHTGVYAGVEAGGLHGQASLALSEYEANGRRDIDLPETSRMQATGDFRASVGQARLGGGYDWRLGGWLAGPGAELRYAKIQQDGFQETGAGQLGLGIADSQAESLASSLGLRASTKLDLGGLQVMPRLSGDWQHQYRDSQPTITAHFGGYQDAAFQVTGLAPVADLAVFAVGFTARVEDRLSAFVDYGTAHGRDYNANSIGLGLQYQF